MNIFPGIYQLFCSFPKYYKKYVIKKACWLLCYVFFLSPLTATLFATELPNIDFTPFFNGFSGAFVFLDLRADKYIRYGGERCQEPLSPCSTFKIPNSMVGLETGVISGPDHLFPWDGIQRSFEIWNRDHTLRSAVKNSVVWYFQRLAQMVGERRMSQYLRLFSYGNQDISGGLTVFWLGSSLKISADEQVAFLKKWIQRSLPVSIKTMDIVDKITCLAKTPEGEFHGKTGSNVKQGKSILGWFVGYVSSGADRYIFALNIVSGNNADGKTAQNITEKILRALKIPID
ncbi:MAG: class D beta-lactamase [Candidatus Riflebacteria bacterium]|nr:class D beta-lactamase [Candidatus Riflebacteria bacterium]